MIDRKLIEDLIKLSVDNNLAELDFADGDQSLSIRRSLPPSFVASAPAAMPAMAAAPAAPAPSGSASSAAPAAADSGAPGLLVKSPMVGTFYSKASPDAPPFTSVGTKVTDSTVVCLVEAMKVFNEIKAGCKGTIVEMLVKDGDAVEYNQPLFRVKP